MYLPRAFAEPDLTAFDDLVARDNFITPITVRGGITVTCQLPALYRCDGDNVVLRGYWARPHDRRHDGRLRWI